MQVAPKLSAGMTSMQHLRTSTTVPAHGGAERIQPWGGAAAPRPQGLRGLGGELRVLPLRRERSRGLRHRRGLALAGALELRLEPRGGRLRVRLRLRLPARGHVLRGVGLVALAYRALFGLDQPVLRWRRALRWWWVRRRTLGVLRPIGP